MADLSKYIVKDVPRTRRHHFDSSKVNILNQTQLQLNFVQHCKMFCDIKACGKH